VNTGDVQVQSGTLNVSSTYHGTNGILRIVIFGMTNYGHFAFGSALTMTGTLAAQLSGGYLPNDGDTFTLLTYPSRTGSFTALNLPPEAVWQASNAPTAFTITASSVCTPPANGLVAWWPGEGSASDLFGTNDGTLRNGVAFAAGEVGQAFSFNGINQFVSTPTAFTNLANTFTIEFWAYPTTALAITTEANSGISGTSSQRYAIFPYQGGGQNAGAGVSVGTNGISVFESGANFLPSPLVYQAAITGWTHVAVVYTNKQPLLYVNGVLVRIGLTSLRASVYPSAGFGGSVLAYGYYAGLLDEVSIYNRALASNEVAAIYSAGSSGKCKGSTPPQHPDPAGESTGVAWRNRPVQRRGERLASALLSMVVQSNQSAGERHQLVPDSEQRGCEFCRTVFRNRQQCLWRCRQLPGQSEHLQCA
jgi:hypothetical protein